MLIWKEVIARPYYIGGIEVIQVMKREKIQEYAILFRDVFNGEPWNDKWNLESASKRITTMLDTTTFFGMEMNVEDQLVGIIWGQEEQWYDGLHFQIQEFCISSLHQGKGIGTRLLNVFVEELKKKRIEHIYLQTSKGELTEGFYKKRGFSTISDMVLMHN